MSDEINESGANNEQSAQNDYPYHKGNPPGRRTKTNDEYRARVFYAAQLLSQLTPKAEVKRMLKARYQVSARMCEVYISRARREIGRWTGKSKGEARIDVLMILRGLLTSGKHWEKLQVIDRYVRLMGLDMPTKIAMTSPDGETPYRPFEADVKDLSDDELRTLARIAERHSQVASGVSGGSPN